MSSHSSDVATEEEFESRVLAIVVRPGEPPRIDCGEFLPYEVLGLLHDALSRYKMAVYAPVAEGCDDPECEACNPPDEPA